jgi:hypothetical protein
MFFPDLGTDCQVGSHPNLRAVGWLSKKQPYSRGEVNTGLQAKLAEHVKTAWQPIMAAGLHECEFCELYRHSHNVWVPSKTVVYVAPAMIVHYIGEHAYCPPKEFLEAVDACPPQTGDEFPRQVERLLGKSYGLSF